MNTKYLFTVLLSIVFNVVVAQNIDNAFFQEADKFFKANVSNGLIDYNKLTKSTQLKTLVEKVSTANLQSADANTKQAFYINAYNLHVINKIVSNYPLSSVMDKAGFFDKEKIMVANEGITLNQLEKDKLLKVYNDARFHFVLVCGALGCPPITDFAYTPNGLEDQMEQQTKLALNDTSFIKYIGTDLKLSEIFKWYAKDFGNNSTEVLNYINKYRNKSISNTTKINYYTYDWRLNEKN